jgi:hypothetical protein
MLNTVQHTQPYSGTLQIFAFPPRLVDLLESELYQVTLPLGNATFKKELSFS